MDNLTGVGASHGTARGRARVVIDLLKPVEIEKGEILVLPFTTPIQSLAIAKAGALVMEVGGRTAHGAVIAREFGIPCVTSVKDATKRLRSGQEIIVDGSDGIVRTE